jgi:hypothetical protein
MPTLVSVVSRDAAWEETLMEGLLLGASSALACCLSIAAALWFPAVANAAAILG